MTQHNLVDQLAEVTGGYFTPVRAPGDDLSSEQVPNLMPYGQSTNAIFGFPATATKAPMLRMIGGAYLLTALLLFAAFFSGPVQKSARPA